MSNGETEQGQTGEPQPAVDGKKVRSTIQFPYGDLDSAIQVARAINDTYGHSCTPDQLAGALNVAATGGQFQIRVSTALIFGLIERDRGRISLSELGSQIIQPPYEAQARASAFLRVPLYRRVYDDFRGRVLPPDTGLENHMKRLGVAPKQADKARQAFRRSADQAGLFGFGRDRLVLPPGTSEDGRMSSVPADSAGPVGTEGAPAQQTPSSGRLTPTGLHSAIAGMLETLPAQGENWGAEEMKDWVTAFEGVLKVVYRVKGS